ncbi:hypothetical protein K458DRAFT_195087 [Lentithecium fluviatile CBS 122367]|uniref:Uncharacterized protein n=1 Tax=Lentithecium fluviatile CBS 122367 TaxID=1168545 RepID=A0A6G1ICK4_9PLEO|nr:hypothetical protein K458DRAFT_195087 [Lentithecium fluviatile CBS 122367]
MPQDDPNANARQPSNPGLGMPSRAAGFASSASQRSETGRARNTTQPSNPVLGMPSRAAGSAPSAVQQLATGRTGSITQSMARNNTLAPLHDKHLMYSTENTHYFC